MKLLVLLFLLTSWSHLGSEARSCDTGIAMSSHVLNIHGSEQAEASVAFLHAYNSTSLENCLEECCSGIYGVCSVATYKNTSESVNCLHFFCEPLKKCKFLPTTFGDSFAFPGALKNIGNSTSHARSITPRKGVENIVISRKGVSSEQPELFDENLSMKNDNTTSKARKGVESSAMSNISVIPLDDFEEVNETISKIKARKGVELFTPAFLPMSSVVTTPEPTSTLLITISSSADFQDSWHSTNETELISDLTKIFQDELDTNSSSFNTPYNVTFPEISSNHTSSDNVTPSIPNLETSFASTSTMVSSSLSVPQTESFILASSVLNFRSSTIKSLPSSAQQSTITPTTTQQVAVLSSSVKIKPSPIVPSSELPEITSNSVEPSNYIIIEHIILDNITSKHPDHPVSKHLKSTEEIERERRYKSSMHLVLSLIVGLLVLCTVMGVVAKRVYDLWMRRHYHRMDFLIDGLYDGYS